MTTQRLLSVIVAAAVALLSAAPAPGFQIIWDFSLDTGGFWTPERREVLTLVEQEFANWTINTANWQDVWDGPGDIWYLLSNPASIDSVFKPANPQANTLVVYLGAGEMNDAFGRGVPAWVGSLSSNPELTDFFAQFDNATTYQAFAGTLFVTTVYPPHLEPDNAPMGRYHLFSTVLRGVGQILGFGTSDAWYHYVDGDGYFKGPHTLALTGGTGALTDGYGNLDNALDRLMSANTPMGVRYTFSELEYAIFRDLGYTIIPEANTVWLLLAGAATLLRRRRIS